MFSIIGLLVVGLLAGLLARAVVPGRDPLGIIGTMILGVVGSFLGGTLWSLLFGDGGFDLQKADTFIGAVIGAVIALLIYRVVAKPRRA